MDFSMNSYLTLILLLLCFIKFKNHFKTITTVLAAPQNQPGLLDHPAQLFAAQWRRSRRKDRKPAAAITLLYKQVPVNVTAIVKTLSCCQYCHKDRLHAVIQQRSNLCQRKLTQSRKSFTWGVKTGSPMQCHPFCVRQCQQGVTKTADSAPGVATWEVAPVK